MRLIYLSIGWCAGIIAASGLTFLPVTVWLAAGLALAVLACLMPSGWRLPVVIITAAALGGARLTASPVQSLLADRADRGGLSIEGVVTQPPRRSGSTLIVRASVQSVTQDGQTVPASENIRIRASISAPVQVGDTIIATGQIISPYVFDRFSYADSLERQGIFALMTDASIQVTGENSAFSVQRGLYGFRDRLSDTIRRHLPEPAAGLLVSIVFGDDSTLSDGVREAFAVSGAAHVLAVSGFNMLVLASTVQALFSRLPVRRELSALLALAVILAYTLMTGASPAILRAALMSALLIVGAALRRKSFLPASLCAAVIGITLLDPNALWDIGFQLSTLTTLALWQFSMPVERRLAGMATWLIPRRGATQSTLLTVGRLAAPNLAASIAAVPLTALHFGAISLVSPIVSLLIVPLQPFIMMVGASATLIGLLWDGLAGLLLTACYVPIAFTIQIVRLGAAIPFAQITTDIAPTILGLALALWIGVTMVAAAVPEMTNRARAFFASRRLSTGLIVCALILFGLGSDALGKRPDGLLHLWFLNMGGQNAVLMRTPDGANVLVDGGAMPANLLTALGERLPFHDRHLALALITRPAAASFGALGDVLSRYSVGSIVTNGQSALDSQFAALMAAHSGTIVSAQRGYRMTFSDGVHLDILSPAGTPGLDEAQTDHALVTTVQYGDIRFLLGGDASGGLQEELTTCCADALAAHVVQGSTSFGRINEAFWTAAEPGHIVLHNRVAAEASDVARSFATMLPDVGLYDTFYGDIHFWTDGTQVWHSQSSG
ncbi:MAG: ComEC/Rec2 family competence protein [Pleurocapsa minor GSE-CHR-MK-17-07R]|jgi:competence protein ComEC|nr:ComEC/Rec2 family competence protein [Pleurocapsa minor GSE-CHR-MK 17-07R]